MPIVTNLREEHWEKDGQPVTTYKVGIDTDWVPCYDDRAKELKLNEPLPEGWEVKTSKRGKPYLAPPQAKRGQMPTAFRNTREGFLAEQQGYVRKDERMDRRTALMQAVEWVINSEPRYEARDTVVIADQFYAWLRATSSADESSTPMPVAEPGSVPSGGADPGNRSGVSQGYGEGSGGTPGSIPSEGMSPAENSPASPATSGPPPTSGLAAGQESEGDGEAAGSGTATASAVQQNPSPAGERTRQDLWLLLVERMGSEVKARNQINVRFQAAFSPKDQDRITKAQLAAVLADLEGANA